MRDPHTRIVTPGEKGLKGLTLQELFANNEYLLNRMTSNMREMLSKAFAEQITLLKETLVLKDQEREEELQLLKEQNALLLEKIDLINERLEELETQEEEKKKSSRGIFGFFRK